MWYLISWSAFCQKRSIFDAMHVMFPPFPHDSQRTSNFSRSITATLRSGRSARSAFAKPQMGAARGRRVRSPGKTETPLWVRNLSWWRQLGKPLLKPKSWNKTIPPKHCMRFMMISDSSFRTLKLKVFQDSHRSISMNTSTHNKHPSNNSFVEVHQLRHLRTWWHLH